MFSEALTTLLPALPSMDALSRPYAPVHYDRQTLLNLAERRMPFWVKMNLRNPADPNSDPDNNSAHLLRYPGVKFDFEVWGAATNLDLSMLKLVRDEQLTDQQVLASSLAGAVTEERRIWRWANPLLVRAHTPLRLQIRYTSQSSGLVNHIGWVVLHGVRLEQSGWMSHN